MNTRCLMVALGASLLCLLTAAQGWGDDIIVKNPKAYVSGVFAGGKLFHQFYAKDNRDCNEENIEIHSSAGWIAYSLDNSTGVVFHHEKDRVRIEFGGPECKYLITITPKAKQPSCSGDKCG